jgi:hypothetical protein
LPESAPRATILYVDPTTSPETWVDTSQTPEGAAMRAVAFLAMLAVSALAALAARDALGRARAESGGVVRRLIGHPAPPEWATGEWACVRCRSVNAEGWDRCHGCRAPRTDGELVLAPPPVEPDIIPDEIAADGALVVLEHDAAAHRRNLGGHWRLRVNNVIAGSAARRDGALALLRALRGADTVMFDPKGTGYARYPLEALITAFEAPRLPFSGPCPEAGGRRPAATPPR